LSKIANFNLSHLHFAPTYGGIFGTLGTTMEYNMGTNIVSAVLLLSNVQQPKKAEKIQLSMAFSSNKIPKQSYVCILQIANKIFSLLAKSWPGRALLNIFLFNQPTKLPKLCHLRSYRESVLPHQNRQQHFHHPLLLQDKQACTKQLQNSDIHQRQFHCNFYFIFFIFDDSCHCQTHQCWPYMIWTTFNIVNGPYTATALHKV